MNFVLSDQAEARWDFISHLTVVLAEVAKMQESCGCSLTPTSSNSKLASLMVRHRFLGYIMGRCYSNCRWISQAKLHFSYVHIYNCPNVCFIIVSTLKSAIWLNDFLNNITTTRIMCWVILFVCVSADYGEKPQPLPPPPDTEDLYEPNLKDEYYWWSHSEVTNVRWIPPSEDMHVYMIKTGK